MSAVLGVLARLPDPWAKRKADADRAYASAEPEAAHNTLLARDYIASTGEIDERDAIVILHALAEALAAQRNLPNGLCDVLQEARAWCVSLDEDYRERMGLGDDR